MSTIHEAGKVQTKSGTSTGEEGQAAVAAYSTVEGATLAASKLVELGFDEHGVGIAPRDYREVDCDPLTQRMASGARRGAVASASIAAVVLVAVQVGFERLVSEVIPLVALATIIGAAAGTLGAAAVAWRRRSQGITTQRPDDLAPSRFEVVVTRRSADAGRSLAGGWHPQSRPVRVGHRRSAAEAASW